MSIEVLNNQPSEQAPVVADLPTMPEQLRDLAEYHSGLANAYQTLANHMIRLDEDPGYAARIAEAEDQVIGDELLSEMQTDQNMAVKGSVDQDRGGAQGSTSTPPDQSEFPGMPPPGPVCDCGCIESGRHHTECPVMVHKRRQRTRPHGPPPTLPRRICGIEPI